MPTGGLSNAGPLSNARGASIGAGRPARKFVSGARKIGKERVNLPALESSIQGSIGSAVRGRF